MFRESVCNEASCLLLIISYIVAIKENRVVVNTPKVSILTFQSEAKKAIAAGAALEDVVNVESRTNLMRARFESGYLEKIDGLVDSMKKEINSAVEAEK